ncbi:TetR/AcrR family transcriptional regulator [Agaribacterium haliotis]|uniref:TetR/AcrR family transcriptional regulator n=1 Tax=Agaribacterium haliotis TaxID=2013869 RepID=UPI000BB55399|nr:TetR/AcrR family transcriptional regulator [Agaribacterium haliotis]
MAGGRKKAFDKNQALDAAMRVFWQKGYASASLSELTEAMGINKPSLYASFGNKEALFIQATEHYVKTVAAKHGQFLHDSSLSLRERLRLFLRSVIEQQCHHDAPKGCYIALCAAENESQELPEPARQKILEVSNLSYDSLYSVLSEDKQARAMKLHVQAADHVNFLLALMFGCASMSRAGKTLSELEPVIEHALAGIGLANETAQH